MRRLVLLFVLALLPASVQAKWLQASSDHFVVYADDGPDNLRRFSEQLERFDAAMRLVMGQPRAVPSPSNRVTIYIVRSDTEVRRLRGDVGSNVYAYYQPRAGGSLAIVPRVDARVGQIDFSMIALLHEYTHHVTLAMSSFPLPRWFMEGSAEFFSSASFERDGTVNLGQPAYHRASELYFAPDVTASVLLDPDMYERRYQRTRGRDAFYGKSWLLYHYLMFDKKRAGQAAAYVQAMRNGSTPVEAARAVFGDLGLLERELDSYLRGRMMMIRVPAAGLEVGPVTLRQLSEGEAAMMPTRIRSKRGVTRQQALELLPEARSVAARFPEDPAVLAALAEAEFDAGYDDAAITAADKALARDPAQANAYVQKGYALFHKAEAAEDKAAAYRAAMVPFQALNKIEADHPLPLIHYYLSFTTRDAVPSKLAVDALVKAVELAPFDLGLRMMLAFQDIRDEKIDHAIMGLKPVAYHPHGGGRSERLRELIAQLEAGKRFTGPELAHFMQDATEGGEELASADAPAPPAAGSEPGGAESAGGPAAQPAPAKPAADD